MDYRLLADDVLLKLLKISDELAYKEIYLRYWRRLFYSAANKTNSKEVAEDIVQSVFADLWDRRQVHNINNIAAYLETAVKYQIINYIKTAISKRAQHTGFTELQKPEELNAAIDKAISQLPQKTQTIFRLSRFEKHTNKDISRIMDLSEKAVEYHITQSLKSLRFFLKDFILVDLVLLIFVSFFN
jgi:RNA polymerase sigma-70 factor (ECF subfamily)